MRKLACLILSLTVLTSCSPEPPLHLYDAQEATMNLPIIDLELEVYWDYYDDEDGYDWRKEWYYGWDEEDRKLFGELGYSEPNVFNLRRYYTGIEANGKHTGTIANTVEGNHFVGRYDWGFWDILVWNDIRTLDGVQSLVFDEKASLDSVTAYTNQTMHPSRYHAPRYTHSFYEPEILFSAYERAIDINRDLTGFTYDPQRDAWVRTLKVQLMPITYIYLTQVIIHNNKGRVTAIDGSSNLSGMARSTTLNSGRAGEDAITVYYNARLKKDCPLLPYGTDPATNPGVEHADIIGGRLMTFGLPGHQANGISRASEVNDNHRHYMDVNLLFNNGIDSTFVFDVTDQVRRRYKGGVITVELNMDTIPIPSRSGGSGFDAVVEDTKDGGTHEFEM